MKASVDFSECTERRKKVRLLIISNISSPNIITKPIGMSSLDFLNTSNSALNSPVAKKRKTKQTNNRKQITRACNITHNDKKYRINNGNEKGLPLYIEPLQKIIEQFEIGLTKWRRVFVYRVELHMPHETESNRVVSLFLKRLFKRLKRNYRFKDIGYAWAREYHGKGKGQHYHFALFLDGNKVRHSSKVSELVQASWERPFGGYTIGYIKRPFYLVDNEEIAKKAMYRLSYLAKTRGKGARPPQTKDYQCSRMKPK